MSASQAARGGDYVVARSRASVLTLSPNQSQPGYCVLWSTKHVAEPFQLDPDRAADFLGDMMAAARAIHRVYGADKLNYQVLGNVVPHLHCHIIPRYVGDRAPGGPILPDARPMHLPPAEHRTQVERLRKALAYSQA